MFKQVAQTGVLPGLVVSLSPTQLIQMFQLPPANEQLIDPGHHRSVPTDDVWQYVSHAYLMRYRRSSTKLR